MIDQLEALKVALGDRYQVEREVGSGGMAVVYLAPSPARPSSRSRTPSDT